MLLAWSAKLGEIAGDECQRLFGVRPTNVGGSTPPRYDLGDVALSFPFDVAKRAGGVKPRDVAIAVAPALEKLPGVRRVDVAGGGYINIFLDRPSLTRALLAAEQAGAPLGRRLLAGKVVIEHTNINPNKAAHIGHVRNAVLGDTLARVLRATGHEVEVQNYIDDTGVQVADVVVGFLDLEGLDAAAVAALPEPFDHRCWDLYARVGRWYEEDDGRRVRRNAVLHEIETGGNPTADLAGVIARRIVRCHLQTAARLGIRYDLLAWEGDILRLGLWAKTFERLKGTDAVRLERDGKNAGCWVMGLEGTDGFKGMEDADKVLVRSNGTATYVAKDIAYQMWKFGLSVADFHYAPYPDPAGDLWTTTSRADQTSVPVPRFGGADHVFNVIDVRQSYLQQVVSCGLEALGFADQSRRSIHYSYEMVAVTPRCAEQLGFELADADRGRPYIEMSGRRGLGVKADDLLDRLETLAAREVAERDPDRAAADVLAVGRAVAIAATRYFMLRFGRTKVVAFDFEEAIKFTGETGPNLQYSVVRCHAIFRRLAAEGSGPTADEISRLDPAALDDLSEVAAEDDAWDLVHHLARVDEVLSAAVTTLELSILAKWAFQTAKRFHKYFERFRIRGETDVKRQRERAALVWLFSARMTRVLDLMGIPVPDRM